VRSMGYRGNQRLNEDIERYIDTWRGTAICQSVKNMYENDSDYESICDVMQIDYEEYEEG